ncbi:hypothetical protein BD779DRAFT_79896 [Infundibulicybe gibba]|nr:hypothetical protein BD779DRAFT_79896 [Infundibulicybe gibba]
MWGGFVSWLSLDVAEPLPSCPAPIRLPPTSITCCYIRGNLCIPKRGLLCLRVLSANALSTALARPRLGVIEPNGINHASRVTCCRGPPHPYLPMIVCMGPSESCVYQRQITSYHDQPIGSIEMGSLCLPLVFYLAATKYISLWWCTTTQ